MFENIVHTVCGRFKTLKTLFDYKGDNFGSFLEGQETQQISKTVLLSHFYLVRLPRDDGGPEHGLVLVVDEPVEDQVANELGHDQGEVNRQENVHPQVAASCFLAVVKSKCLLAIKMFVCFKIILEHFRPWPIRVGISILKI
jgi:hypothetical protein